MQIHPLSNDPYWPPNKTRAVRGVLNRETRTPATPPRLNAGVASNLSGLKQIRPGPCDMRALSIPP